jgi:urease accessory protein
MRRVASVLVADSADQSKIIDRVVLDADDRTRRRFVLTGEKGTTLLLDFPQPVTLHDGDGLVLDNGSIVLVAGVAEPLAEIASPTPLDFVRVAWHLGNRHADVQFLGDRLRIRRDHVLEEMVKGLGAAVTPVDAPFDPEADAPAHGHAHEHHHHDHRHDT